MGWPGCYINVWHFRGLLLLVLLQLKHPLELFVKRREFLPSSEFVFCHDMIQAVEGDLKTHSFIPSG